MSATPTHARRPTDIVVVTFLAAIAAFGDVAAGITYLVSGPDEGDTHAVAWATLVIGLATAAIAALLFRGSNTARWIIAALMFARIGAHVWAWITIGSDAAVAAMIEILIAVVVLVLLFSRESTAFVVGVKN